MWGSVICRALRGDNMSNAAYAEVLRAAVADAGYADDALGGAEKSCSPRHPPLHCTCTLTYKVILAYSFKRFKAII